MGRFFQTAPTQFVEDYIYQPPWELMDKVAAIKQAEYDSVAQKTDLLNNALLQIKHLNGETDVANVKEIQRYYNDQINQITEHARNNPQDAAALQRNIDKLQKEMLQDFTAGNISKIQGSYNAYEQFKKDNEQLKKDNPSRYAAGEKYYLGQYAEAGGDSLNRQFKGELITKDIDYEAIRKSLSELKANKIKSTKQTPSGGLYMVETENGLEEMSKERMNGWMLSQILTPENLASLSQSERYGLGTYRDDEGHIDYDNGSLFAPLRGFAEAGNYKQIEESLKYSANSAAIAQMNEAGTNNRFYAELNYKKNKDAQDRIDNANKTKEEKINAYEREIAEGWIQGGEEGKKRVAFFENAKNNLLGTSGIYQSNLGSKFKSFSELQVASSKGDKDAQKILSQNLNSILKQAGINFNDPKQKVIAQEVIGLIKQNKLNKDDISNYLDKKIPAKINRTVDNETLKFLKNRSEITAQQEIKKNNQEIETKRNQILQNKNLGNDPNALKRIEKLKSEIYALQKRNQNISPDLIYKESIEEFKKGYKGYKDSNENFRNNLKTNLQEAFSNMDTKFKEKLSYSTTYETAPLNITAQSTIKSLLRDPDNIKEVTIEDGITSGPLGMTVFNKLKNIVSVTTPDGYGRFGVIALDDEGKQYKITANVGTPTYKAIMNIAKANVNPNTPVGLSINYPTIAILKQQIEARKTLGQYNTQFNITSVKGNTYTIKQVGNTDKYNVYDSFGNLQTKKGPVDYVQAGIGIDINDNK